MYIFCFYINFYNIIKNVTSSLIFKSKTIIIDFEEGNDFKKVLINNKKITNI